MGKEKEGGGGGGLDCEKVCSLRNEGERISKTLVRVVAIFEDIGSSCGGECS